MACELCELVGELDARGELYEVGNHWVANERQSPGRPAIVLQAKDHRPGLESLGAAEASEMGVVLTKTAALLQRQPGVERVYAQTFNETPGNHLHIHVTPRFRGETRVGPSLDPVAAVPTSFRMQPVLEGLRRLPAGGQLTQRVRRILGWLGTLPIAGKARHPYRCLCRNLERSAALRGASRFADAGELFVVGSLCLEIIFTLLIGLLANVGSAPSRVVMLVLALPLAARALDIAAYQMGILLQDEQSALQGNGRSLLLALANLVELGVITAGGLIALGVPHAQAVLEGARVTTFQNDLEVQGALLPSAVVALAMATAILVAVGSVGLAVGRIADTFHRS